jgi:hypothetical protein
VPETARVSRTAADVASAVPYPVAADEPVLQRTMASTIAAVTTVPVANFHRL